MKTIAFYTFGCKTNQYETQIMKEAVLKRFTIVDKNDSADIYVINTCAVTKAASDQSRQLLRKLQRQNPHSHIIYTGCDSYLIDETDYSVSHNIHIVGNSYKNDIFSALSCAKDTSLETKTYNIEKCVFSWNKSRPFVKIQEGCENFCTYCVVAHLRGKQRSKDAHLVLEEIKNFADQGFKEIVLTGTNIGSYRDLKELLRKINQLELDFRVRLSSIEPMYVDNELIDIISDGKFAKHLHIPLQSASNRILELSRRNYTCDDFEKIVNYASLKGIFLGTDIIVGFEESEEDFSTTYNFVKNNDITYAHIFTYSHRPLTKQVSYNLNTQILKERSIKLKELINKKFKQKMNEFVGKNTQIVMQAKRIKLDNQEFNLSVASQYFKVLTKIDKSVLIDGKITKFDGVYAYFER
ncbi:tRNA-t(6)A37 methylthiotransferase [Desulfurella amilsii]|uniref:tRNA-t(6)A37 methylthiotransferase n=1 Tax=Desulfurella amilsii TaxID=1562698 RepID=A0A1X4XXE4_9BACT|nr:MiaB/RimO family radical SAM methylthiotransferase [Desulfurella amilsii]OSS42212.1 tRNA-t(6)A37 methylthiotransferase [Desulfurella amilsii]